MDHCTFPSIEVAQETMHWWGFNGGAGWTTDTGDVLAGSANIFTIEDSSFCWRARQLFLLIPGILRSETAGLATIQLPARMLKFTEQVDQREDAGGNFTTMFCLT